MLGRLLGNAWVETIASHTHLAPDSVCRSAVRISGSIANDMLRRYQWAAS